MKYSNITTMKEFKAFLNNVDSADFWNDFDYEEYKSACEFAGLNYHDYDDPDALFDDLRKFAERKEKTMTKLLDSAGHVFTEGENIDKIMEELNKDNGEWEYWYRHSCGVVDAYFSKDGESDVRGENADEIYEVVED